MKILLVSYYYPPMGGAGVQRALKFSKYLGAFGVEPVVLAADNPGYVADASLAKEIAPGIAVHRVAHRPLLPRLMQWWRAAARGEPPAFAAAPSANRERTSPWKARLRDVALRTYAALQFPDDKAAWARRALREARRILRSEQIDLIFTSAPPVSAHALGARLSREFGLPWVADYRDLWTEVSSQGAPAWRRALDRRVEAGWLRQASGVVTVTPSWSKLLAQRLGPHCPVAFIPNGYDEADFFALPVPPLQSADAFTIVHTGTFYGPRDPGAFLDGVSLYLKQAGATTRPLRVRLIGNIGARFDARLQQFECDHPKVVERVPYLPHRQALAELLRADALLLVVGGWHGAAGAGLLPGKIFEYLRAARPVLLIGPEEGDAAELVRRHARGHIVDENPERIARALDALLRGATTAAPPTHDGDVAHFERRELTRQLAAFLIRCKEAHARA